MGVELIDLVGSVLKMNRLGQSKKKKIERERKRRNVWAG